MGAPFVSVVKILIKTTKEILYNIYNITRLYIYNKYILFFFITIANNISARIVDDANTILLLNNYMTATPIVCE